MCSDGDGITFPMKDEEEEATSRLLGQHQRWAEEGDTEDTHGMPRQVLSTYIFTTLIHSVRPLSLVTISAVKIISAVKTIIAVKIIRDYCGEND